MFCSTNRKHTHASANVGLTVTFSKNKHHREPLTMSTQVLTEVFSDAFAVYSAKNFPGMTRKYMSGAGRFHRFGLLEGIS